MPKLGTEVRYRNAAPAASNITDTNTGFIVGLTDQGFANQEVKVNSLAEFEATFGPSSTTNLLFNDVDVFFREGGETAYVSREVGPTPVNASVVLKDSAAKETVKVEAKYPGEYANKYKIVVTGAEGAVYIETQTAGAVKLEKIGPFATRAETLAGQSSYLTISAAGVSVKQPAAETSELSGTGTDNRASISGGEVKKCAEAALAGFASNETAGQLLLPEGTATGAHEALLNAAALHGRRVACLDIAKGTEAEVKTALETAIALPNAEFGAAFVGNLKCPGLVGGTERTISASVVAAALAARADLTSPNTAPCGVDYGLLYCTATDSQFSEGERETLFNEGGNTFNVQYGVLSLFGWQALVLEATSGIYDQFNHTRTRCAITAKAKFLESQVAFKPITESLLAAYKSKLTTMLLTLWGQNVLDGRESSEAFSVNVGPAVNTPASIERQEVKAVIEARLAPYASFIVVELVSVPLGSALTE